MAEIQPHSWCPAEVTSERRVSVSQVVELQHLSRIRNAQLKVTASPWASFLQLLQYYRIIIIFFLGLILSTSFPPSKQNFLLLNKKGINSKSSISAFLNARHLFDGKASVGFSFVTSQNSAAESFQPLKLKSIFRWGRGKERPSYWGCVTLSVASIPFQLQRKLLFTHSLGLPKKDREQ